MALDKEFWMYMAFGFIGLSAILLIFLATIACAYCLKRRARRGKCTIPRSDEDLGNRSFCLGAGIGEPSKGDEVHGLHGNGQAMLTSFLREPGPGRYGNDVTKKPLSERMDPAGAAAACDGEESDNLYPIVVEQAHMAVISTHHSAQSHSCRPEESTLSSSGVVAERKPKTPESMKRLFSTGSVPPQPSQVELRSAYGSHGQQVGVKSAPSHHLLSDGGGMSDILGSPPPTSPAALASHPVLRHPSSGSNVLSPWNEEDENADVFVFSKSLDDDDRDIIANGDAGSDGGFGGGGAHLSPVGNNSMSPSPQHSSSRHCAQQHQPSSTVGREEGKPLTPNTHRRQPSLTSSQLEEILPSGHSPTPGMPVASSTPRKPFRSLSSFGTGSPRLPRRNKSPHAPKATDSPRVAGNPGPGHLPLSPPGSLPGSVFALSPGSVSSHRPLFTQSPIVERAISGRSQRPAQDEVPSPGGGHRPRSGSLDKPPPYGARSYLHRRQTEGSVLPHTTLTAEDLVDLPSASVLLERMSFRGERNAPLPRPPVSKAPPLEASFLAMAAARRTAGDRPKSASSVVMATERRDVRPIRPWAAGQLPEEPTVSVARAASEIAMATAADGVENPYMMPTDGLAGDDPIYEMIRSRRASRHGSSGAGSRAGYGQSNRPANDGVAVRPRAESGGALGRIDPGPGPVSGQGGNDMYRASTLYQEVSISESKMLMLDRIGASNA